LCRAIETATADDLDAFTVYEIRAKVAELRFYDRAAVTESPGEPLPSIVREHVRGHSVTSQFRHPLRRAIDAMIAAASERSTQTCETCGRPGTALMDGSLLFGARPAHRSQTQKPWSHVCAAKNERQSGMTMAELKRWRLLPGARTTTRSHGITTMATTDKPPLVEQQDVAETTLLTALLADPTTARMLAA